VFAKLVALALYGIWRERGEDFVPGYLEFLSAGASAAPAELLKRLGVDLHGSDVWDIAFTELERMTDAAEAEAGAG
jgi:oligoendopeptidase F